MRCPSCGHDSPESAKFCLECGARLALACSLCGAELPAGAKFCLECGQAVASASPQPSRLQGESSTSQRERATEGRAAPSAHSEPVEGPTSFANGRYAVRRFLGEGGKKRVYLAHDTTLDRDVAFALIKTEGLDEAARARITREAQAMGRLGDHRHIVTIFDVGVEPSGSLSPGGRELERGGQDGQPYLVLPLMPGGDVQGLIEKAENHQLPLELAIRITDQLCQALEHAHARGIIHRDIKPGNVRLASPSPQPFPTGRGGANAARPGEPSGASPDRREGFVEGRADANVIVKLGDFGLAAAIDRSRLTQAGMMVGTVSYMPPEQALGTEITPRSDLYSVGCML